MDKATVIEALKKIQDFDSERNHAECLLLNLIDDADVAEAYMDAQDKTKTGYMARLIKFGADEPEDIRAMQMIEQIMMDDVTDTTKHYPAICAWFRAKYEPMNVITYTR